MNMLRTSRQNHSPQGFTTKRAERRAHVLMRSSEASAGREPVRGFITPSEKQYESTLSYSSRARGTNPRSRGFTLVETLVAITIIATAMTGPFYAVQQALNASRGARDQLIASSLAQEGIEYVRAVRDSNYLAGRSWFAGLDGTSGDLNPGANCFAMDCVIDPAKRTARTTITPLYLADIDNDSIDYALYNQQQSGSATPYTRKVRLAQVSGNPHEVTVTVTVTWMTKDKPYTVTITEVLNNWL